MTDIVERLRTPYEWRVVNKRFDDAYYNEAPLDAADEIEKLRDELYWTKLRLGIYEARDELDGK